MTFFAFLLGCSFLFLFYYIPVCMGHSLDRPGERQRARCSIRCVLFSCCASFRLPNHLQLRTVFLVFSLSPSFLLHCSDSSSVLYGACYFAFICFFLKIVKVAIHSVLEVTVKRDGIYRFIVIITYPHTHVYTSSMKLPALVEPV